jgi:Tfp pilus assembly protein PilO
MKSGIALKAKTYMIFTIASAVVGFSGVIFLMSKSNEASGEFSSLKKELKDENKVQKEFLSGKSKLIASQEKLDHLEAGVPSSAYVPTLLSELEHVGKEKGLILTGVKPKPVKEEKLSADDKKKGKKLEVKAYNELAIEVKGMGKYLSLPHFVQALESFPKIVGVTAIDISPKSGVQYLDENGQSPLEMTVLLKAYAFPEPGEKKQADENTDEHADRGKKNSEDSHEG